MSALKIRPLSWDTDFFGCSCAKAVIEGEMKEADLERLLSASEQYAFLTIVNVSNLPWNNRIIGSETKAYLADINLQFEKKLASMTESGVGSLHCEIVAGQPRNERLLDMTQGTYCYSRFYTDRKLKERKGDQMHIQWLENAFEKPDQYFLIGKDKLEAVGYILFSMDSETKSARIELLAVSRDYRRQAIGRKMMNMLEGFLTENGIECIFVGTQLDNTPAVNFYHKCGFSEKSLSSIYHLWHGEEQQ